MIYILSFHQRSRFRSHKITLKPFSATLHWKVTYLTLDIYRVRYISTDILPLQRGTP